MSCSRLQSWMFWSRIVPPWRRRRRRKGFAALSIHTQSMPYRHVIVEGTARAGSPVDNVWRERVAMRYMGEAAGKAYVRESGDWDVVAIHVRPLKWWTQGFMSG